MTCMSLDTTMENRNNKLTEEDIVNNTLSLFEPVDGIIITGARDDISKIIGTGPLAPHITLRDEEFIGGGVGLSFFSEIRNPVTGEIIPIHVKFLDPITALDYIRTHKEAQAAIDLYKGRHAQSKKSKPFEHQSYSPFIVPRLISLEKIDSKGIEPFEKHTKDKIMIVTERIPGEDLSSRDINGHADILNKRLEDFLDHPSYENAEKIKKYSLFRKLKWRHFSFDTATLHTGKRVYCLKDKKHVFEEGESYEILDLFKKDLVLAVCRAGIQLTEALAEVHENGMVHQDIKPQNVIIDKRGALRLIDFGFVQKIDELDPTPKNERVGTPLYWSLEYLRTGITTIQTEIWPVSCILFELLTGENIINDFDSPKYLIKQLHDFDSEYDLEEYEGRIPEEFMKIIKKGLKRNEKDRFHDMREYSQELRSFMKKTAASQASSILAELRWLK